MLASMILTLVNNVKIPKKNCKQANVNIRIISKRFLEYFLLIDKYIVNIMIRTKVNEANHR